MKKKFREIVVDDNKYTWSVRNNLDGDGSNFIKIWKIIDGKKKLIYDDIYDNYDEDPDYKHITPKKIKDIIVNI